MKTEFYSSSPEETQKIAENFARSLSAGDVIAYFGDLGMGKTCFTRGLALGLGFSGDVTSPTFALVNEYRGGRLDLFHFDMYRVTGWDDLYSTGFFEYKDECGVIAVEWSENIEGALDDDTIRITFSKTGDNSRKITIEREEQNDTAES